MYFYMKYSLIQLDDWLVILLSLGLILFIWGDETNGQVEHCSSLDTSCE